MSDLNVNSEEFVNLLADETRPILVDFWASWCGPCRMLAGLVEKTALAVAETIKVVKVNIDECPELSDQYNIQSIPTICVFKAGQCIKTVVGAPTKVEMQELIQWISEQNSAD